MDSNCTLLDKPGRAAVTQHLLFTAGVVVLLLLLGILLRLALLLHNSEQIGGTPVSEFMKAFLTGVRFDLRLVAIACLPLVLALASPTLMRARRWMRAWLALLCGMMIFLGVLELDFYREFNQRLNGLVFQYMKEDPRTVMSMLWFGFPVVRYLLVWALFTWVTFLLLDRLDRATPPPAVPSPRPADAWYTRLAVMLLCLLLSAVAARGTLRQGAPLRWGDAFVTESMFANQLGLNGTLTLAAAALGQMNSHRENIWKSRQTPEEATTQVRKLLLTRDDTPVDVARAAVRRDYQPPAAGRLPVKNVVFILMESFSGLHTGALGSPNQITPYFDKLAEEGVLFTRFFSNGTHTHQGMFASFGCFPNLPGFEYLMQTQEGGNRFSGLPQLLGERGYDNLYVYNGDFSWDNQSGFFGKQGVTNFIGRFDFVNPVVFDPTWGVSDQDMFDRAAAELAKKSGGKPFYAMLQTLSNHTPYPLPEKLPVDAVQGHGTLDQHLTAMRYSDWALGQFFEKVRKEPYYKETLFVIVGDHAFPTGVQLTEMGLARFNVPLLLIAPGIRERFGARRDIVGTQVDIVPTIMGRLGGTTRHQCWGRDLLNLPANDPGFGMIKPSGNDQSVAFIRGQRILVESDTRTLKLYDYQLGAAPQVRPVDDAAAAETMRTALDAYIQTATQSLLNNTTGHLDGK